MNRLSIAPVDYDAVQDGAYSAYPEGTATGAVAVLQLEADDAAKTRFHDIFNITDTTINPNGDTTYDAAPIGSRFTDGPGGKFYVKSASDTWTEVT